MASRASAKQGARSGPCSEQRLRPSQDHRHGHGAPRPIVRMLATLPRLISREPRGVLLVTPATLLHWHLDRRASRPLRSPSPLCDPFATRPELVDLVRRLELGTAGGAMGEHAQQVTLRGRPGRAATVRDGRFCGSAGPGQGQGDDPSVARLWTRRRRPPVGLVLPLPASAVPCPRPRLCSRRPTRPSSM